MATPPKLPKTDDEIVDGILAYDYPSKCKHLMRKHLSKDVYSKIKGKKTKMGGTIGHCLYSGLIEYDAKVAFHATDPEAYEVFAPLTDLIIRDYHKIPADQPLKHPAQNFGDANNLPFTSNVDPEGKYVISTRIRVGRAAKGYAWPPIISKEARNQIESMAKAAYGKFTGDLAGEYKPLTGMSVEEEQALVDEHFLFRNDDKYKQPSGGGRDWPEGRGIFISKDRKFLSWVNEGDHFRFISMEKGADVASVLGRLARAVTHLEKEIPFARSDRLGSVSFCPTNLGTGCRASVHIKIPKLSKKTEELQKILDKFGLQKRGTGGELDRAGEDKGIVDISNLRRLGLSEIETITDMAVGVQAIIKAEKALE